MRTRTLFLIPILILLSIYFISNVHASSGVLCEYLTASSCQACPSVSQYLEEIYDSHNYPFYYISFVTDKNEDAEKLSHEYNVFGYPTAFFNGGYVVVFGKHEKQEYINAIKKCMERETKISLKTEAYWEKDTLSIYVNVTNNYDSYNGRLKVYIVKPVSEWKDYAGDKFHYAFIGYAMNKEISIQKGKHSYHTTWKANMTDNIMLVAALFNSNGETRYSDPPYNNHAFQAHFVDAVAATKPKKDMPPIIKIIKKPENVTGYRNVSFEWTGSDDHGPVSFSYKLYGEDWSSWGEFTRVNYSNLQDGTYTFMVRAKDDIGQITEVSYTFRVDTSPPHITYTYPKNNGIDFKPYEAIIIKFSHFMEKSSIKIKFSPSAEYTVEWKNKKELHIFAALRYETKYTMTIEGRRDSGQKMKPYSITFETAPPDLTRPRVVAASPYYGEYYNGISIKFSKAMDRDIFKGVKIEPYEPFKYSWKDNDTLLEIKLYSINVGAYDVYVTEYMEDKYGNHLIPFHFKFYITKPHIVYNTAENQTLLRNEAIEIKFSHDMDRKSVENGIKIFPKCNYSIEWDGNRSIKIIGNWSEKEYIVKMENLKDIRGVPMDNYTFRFYTWSALPYYHGVRQTPSFSFVMMAIAVAIIMLRRKKNDIS